MNRKTAQLGLMWPPQLVLGCRVFYSRHRAKEWFAAREAKSPVRGNTRDL